MQRHRGTVETEEDWLQSQELGLKLQRSSGEEKPVQGERETQNGGNNIIISYMNIIISNTYFNSIWRKEGKAQRESLKLFIPFNSRYQHHRHPLHHQRRSRPFHKEKQSLMLVSNLVLTKCSSSATRIPSFTVAGCL